MSELWTARADWPIKGKENSLAASPAIPYVCPACHGDLLAMATALRCSACGATYPRLDTAYVDFAGPNRTFDDWWMQTPEKQQRWLSYEAPKEEEYEIGLARRFILPLLDRLHYAPGHSALLSAGCGLGADVDFLNETGYPTWGVDCGNRVQRWSMRRYRERLARADVLNLPFPDAAFDFVLALNLLEHIGVVGDTTTVTEDYEAQRLQALHSLLRVTKPGGYVLLSGLNRTIPIDIGHVQNVRFARFHSPWERFLLSYGDVKRLCWATGQVDWTEPLPLRGFFSWTTLRRYHILRPVLPLVDWLFGCFPNAVYGSWLSFFWIVLVRRRMSGTASLS